MPCCSRAGRRSRSSIIGAHDCFGALVILDAVVEAVIPTIDPFGNRLELLLVCQFVETIQLPKLTGNAKAYFPRGSYRRVVNQIEAEQLTILRVVGPSGQLNWSAAFVAFAISRLRIAKVSPAFVCSAGSNLFHVTQFGRFMGQLRQESRLAEVRANVKLLHGLLNKGKIIGAFLRRAIGHDLSEFIIGEHLW